MKTMSMKEIDKASTTKATATRGRVYTIYTNKNIEYLLNKPTIISMNDKQV